MPSRPLNGLERVWLVADRLWAPFVNQQVLEGEGPLDVDAWRAAVAATNAAWPAARARLRGSLGWTEWVDDGPAPAVVEVDGAGWDAHRPAPFLERRLDPWSGPVAEVLLVHGATPRVVLRTHHAAFDGAAAAMWAADLAAALDGRAIEGGPLAAAPRDVELAPPGPPAAEPPRDRRPATGAPSAPTFETTWRRVTVPTPKGDVLGRVLRALGDAAATFDPTPLRVSVPVDLRRARPGLRATGNLTGLATVDLGGKRPLADALADCGGAVRAADKLRSVPLAWMESTGRSAARQWLTTGACAVSATVSNLGLQPAFSGGAFRAARSFWIPPAGTPLFLTLTGHAEGLELCATAPEGLADRGRLDVLLGLMATSLEPEPTPVRATWRPGG